MCFFGHRFGRVLESVLGEFWDAKILDFRSFFDVFSKHFSNIILEGQKIEKFASWAKFSTILGRTCGMRGLLGREK